MTADQLRELADVIEPMGQAPRFSCVNVPAACAYLRACADALDAGPVAWHYDGRDHISVYPIAMPGALRLPEPMTDKSKEPDMQSAWISVQDRMPPDDTPVLVYVPGNEMLAFVIDQWLMQCEAPLGWSSATIETGMGWGEHDYEDVSHWMPLTAPGQPLDIDDQLIADEYAGMLRMIDDAMGETNDPR